jgi:hypothetical protein
VWAELAPESSDPADLFVPRSAPKIRAAIEEVVRVEAPVFVEEVCRQVAAAFGVKRLTDRTRRPVLDQVEALAGALRLQLVGAVVWPGGVDPEAWDRFRGPDATGKTRDPALIPDEELSAAARAVLREALSLPEEALVREMADRFGLNHRVSKVKERMRVGVERLITRGEASRDGERVRGG